MPRITSEIIKDFKKISDDVGLTKLAEDEHQKYKDDPTARAGSDDISTIEALYGVKPDSIYEYERSIMESAHPNSVIIAPSYDKINGLVENNIERQNIIINRTLKPNEGNHYNPKYAHQQLIMELVRIANEMDNKNHEELRKLADSCLTELSARQRQFKKEALGPLAIVAIAAVCLGAVWLAAHASSPDNGPLANADNSIQQLEDLKTNSWYESDVDATVQAESDKLINNITKLKNAIIKFNTVTDAVYKPRTLSELQELIKLKDSANQHGDEVKKAVDEFKHTVLELEPLLTQAIDNFTNTVYQKQHTTPSTISDLTSWVGEAVHGRWGLVANDFISAANALKPLKESLEAMTSQVENFDKVVAKYEADVQNANAKFTDIPQVAPTEQSNFSQLISDITGKPATQNEVDFLKHLKQ